MVIVVMGATGHVGAAVAAELLERGEDIAVLARDPSRAGALADRGARVVVADAGDVASLRAAFADADRAFLLNPPGDTGADSDAAERRTIAAILAALDGASLDKVVAASTYGAQPGDGIGDLGTLWRLEDGLRAQSVPAAINRGAYYMTNWLAFLDTVRDAGVLPSLFPADVQIPMVAPADLGRAAAERLLSPPDDDAIEYVEGPARYTPRDVADAFAAALGREVSVQVVPRDRWEATFREAGFSAASARSYVGLTGASLDADFDKPESPRRGATDLSTFIAAALA